MLEYPRKWKNKKSGQIVRVMPWLEVPEDFIRGMGLSDEKEFTKAKIGVLVQIGYLIESAHGVWIGVESGASEHFEDQGPCIKEKSAEVVEKSSVTSES